jgi:hypothetical protein
MTPRRKKSPTPDEHQPAPEEASPPTPAPGPEVAGTEEGNTQPTTPEAAQRSWQPDPFALRTITLGSDKDSPRMTLFRSNKLNQVAIRFDQKPAAEHRERLRVEGYRWREDEGVWTKQLDRERRATSQMEAERLFTAIGEAIRAELGLGGRTGVGG